MYSKKDLQNLLNQVSYEAVCKSIQYSGVRFVAGVTSVTYEANVGGLELETLQLQTT